MCLRLRPGFGSRAIISKDRVMKGQNVMDSFGKYKRNEFKRPGKRVYPEDPARPDDIAPFGNEGPYKGFLLIKCGGCGEIRAFCAKKELFGSRCKTCQHQTPLENLRPMYLRCKCGKEFRYKTNITEDAFTHECIECGAPVDLTINKRKTAYVTVRNKK